MENDLISRSAAIEALLKQPNTLTRSVVRRVLRQVPGVDSEKWLYTAHEVAEIIAELFGDRCACNFNGIDEWLPDKCELQYSCPNPFGVACWEQYLKYHDAKMEG